jgi:hypothetical protein
MSKLVGAPGIATKESALANYYRWEEPYSDITVCLNLDTADYLQAEVLGGIGSFALSAAAATVILAVLSFYETGEAPRFDSPRPVLATNSTGALRTAPAEPLAKPPVLDRAARGTLVENKFVGPQIIHKAAPAIPPGVGAKITTPVQIDVTVTIDEGEEVTGAQVTLEALKAAQPFRFRPAEENNRHARSDTVRTFRFAPKAL